MMSKREPIPPPHPALLALEARAWFELVALLPALPLLALAPRGDGHAVLVLPGFLASDLSTAPLRRFLSSRGYDAHGWSLGRNHGPTPETIVGLGRRFAEVRARQDRKMSLIGWSLGGIYARELARRFPSDVRQVITLASPFRDPGATAVSRWRSAWRGRDVGSDGARAEEANRDRERQRALVEPLDVPTTSLFSRTDGIVAWRSCLEEPGPLRENIEVQTSHTGMGHHPGVLLTIADRLAQAEGEWRPWGRRGFWG
jgi:pimeloyl-ACP methyl ester carboxylesterase